jgi:hypothetical protein
LFVLLAGCGTKESVEKEETEKPTEETKETTTSTTEGESAMYPQLSTEVASNEALVVMNTTMGAIKIKLFPEIAPKTVENFITHAENGYYDGIIFHRIIQDFMIQGGDQLVQVWVEKVFTDLNSKMSSRIKLSTCVAHYQWPTLVLVQTEASSLSFKLAVLIQAC